MSFRNENRTQSGISSPPFLVSREKRNAALTEPAATVQSSHPFIDSLLAYEYSNMKIEHMFCHGGDVWTTL
jgi:hypothetical protein